MLVVANLLERLSQMKACVGRSTSSISSRIRYARRFAAPDLHQHVPSTVHVLVTTVEGTRAAIAAAMPVARTRRSPLVLLVERDDWQTARCLRAAHELDPAITAKQLVGPSPTEAVKAVVPVRALVVIGGPTQRWWPTRHQRLAARLQRHGRDVRFVGCAIASGSSNDSSETSHRRDPADVQRFAR